MELDLTRPRDLSEILGACGDLYRRYFVVFAAIALVVVIPIDIVTLGLIDGQLLDYDSEVAGGGVAYSLCFVFVSTPLITAGHVVAVMQIGAGERPSIRASVAQAGRMLLPVMLVILISTIGWILGLILLIIPGVFLYVRWFVASQSVVAEGLGPIAGLRYSWRLVADNWWRVFGISIVIGLLAGIMSAIVGVPITLVAEAVESGVLLLVATILFDAIILSFAALAGTILFFDLKARKFPAPITLPDYPPPNPLGRPEAPVA